MLVWVAVVVLPHISGRTGITEATELRTADLRFRLTGQQAPVADIVLVALDDETLEATSGAGRAELAGLIRNISASGAGALAMDVLLADERDTETDSELADALASVPSTIAAAARFEGEATSTLLPHPKFAAVAQTGLVNISTDTGGTPRYMPLVLEAGGAFYPAMALSAVVLFTGEQASFGPNDLSIGSRSVPLNEAVYLPLRHLGPAGTVRTISAELLLAGPRPDLLDGKLVVLGFTASGVGDRFPTPFDDSTPGVEIIATAVSQMLGGSGLRRDASLRWWDAAHALVLTGLCFLALVRLPLSRAALAVSVFVSISCLIAWAVFAAGIWISMAVPLLAAVPPVFAGAGLRYMAERRSAVLTERAASALSRFQAPALADRIARDPDYLVRPEDRFMAILFVDLSGFTGLSQRLGPDGTRDLLRRFHELTGEAVGQAGGSVLNYMGDGALAVFGLEAEESGGAADAAMRASFAIVGALENARMPEAGQGQTSCRIGLHYGPVVLSRLGASSQQQVTVSGDNVNLASRLMETAKETGAVIVASQDFAAALKEAPAYQPEERDGIAVRGRSGDISIVFWTAAALATRRV